MCDLGIGGGVLSAIAGVIARHGNVSRAVVFGSRAKGTYKPGSDIDIALYGAADFRTAEEIKCELDNLPFAHSFDVIAYETISNPDLKEQIDKHGVEIWRKS